MTEKKGNKRLNKENYEYIYSITIRIAYLRGILVSYSGFLTKILFFKSIRMTQMCSFIFATIRGKKKKKDNLSFFFLFMVWWIFQVLVENCEINLRKSENVYKLLMCVYRRILRITLTQYGSNDVVLEKKETKKRYLTWEIESWNV